MITVPALDWLPAPFGAAAGGSGAGDGDSSSSDAAAAGEVLLHRDLHPKNVILTPDGLRIIDWEGASRGPAVADLALTWVITAFSEIPGPRVRATAGRTVRALFARAFLRAAGRWTAAGWKSPPGTGLVTATCFPPSARDWSACCAGRISDRRRRAAGRETVRRAPPATVPDHPWPVPAPPLQ